MSKRSEVPTGDLPPLHPNQVERIEFTFEQMKALSSAIRADVFWSTHAFERKSVNDISKEVGKSAQAVHYHMNALVELGLVVPAETRQKRSRTEQLYLRRARTSTAPMFGVSEAYNRYRVRGLKLETQRMVEEDAYFWGTTERSDEFQSFSAFRKYRLMLTKERAEKLRWDLVNLLLEAFTDQTPAENGGVQVNTVVYMRPTIPQIRKWAESQGIPFKDLSREKLPEGDNEE